MIRRNSEAMMQNAFQSEEFEHKYYKDKKIGEGMHSEVFRCYLIEDELRLVPFAVKITREDDLEKQLLIDQENDFTKQIVHPNIVSTVDFFKKPFTGEIFQVLTYATGEELQDIY